MSGARWPEPVRARARRRSGLAGASCGGTVNGIAVFGLPWPGLRQQEQSRSLRRCPQPVSVPGSIHNETTRAPNPRGLHIGPLEISVVFGRMVSTQVGSYLVAPTMLGWLGQLLGQCQRAVPRKIQPVRMNC